MDFGGGRFWLLYNKGFMDTSQFFMKDDVCRQFKKQDVIWASEIQQVRDFGTESATQQVQAEVVRKLGRLRNDAETTFEYHLFNGIQGLVKDPRDGATVVNYFTGLCLECGGNSLAAISEWFGLHLIRLRGQVSWARWVG